MSWPPYVARENAIAELERAIAANPAALDTRFYYAAFLRDHGRFDDAIAAFEAIVAAAPDHVDTLIALGVVLAQRGRRLEARARFEHAVACDERHAGALVNLANLCALDEPGRARGLYDRALALDADNVPAHRGLCSLAVMQGDAAAAERHRVRGFAGSPFGTRRYYGAALPMLAIALVSTGGGNMPIDMILDPARFHVTELFVEAYHGETLPAHAVLLNAIADPDRSANALHIAVTIVARSKARVVNDPAAVLACSRRENARRFAVLEDVVAPAVSLARENVPDAYPVILRVPGVHMGRAMIRADDPAARAAAVRTLTNRDDLLAIEYVDTRSADGAWRKYRVMAIGGRLYPLHLAIGERWDVHYFSSAMWDNAEYRAEEAQFLGGPVGAIGTRAWRALERVSGLLNLDYAGIDFGLDAQGRAVVFEANPAMTVLRPDADERFAYRTAAADAIEVAINELVDRGTGSNPSAETGV